MVNVSRVLLNRKSLILSLFALVFISVFSFAVFAQEISTDKSDYSPGEIVTITGTGFDANANLQIKITGYISGSIAVPAALDSVTADDSGSFQYYYFLNGFAEEYKIEVLDSADNVLASYSFTDTPKVVSVTVGSQSVTLTQGTDGSATYTITVTRGSSGPFTADLTITTSLPSGASYSFSPNSVSFAPADTSKTSTLTITIDSTTPAGSTNFTVKATRSNDVNDFATGDGTLLIDLNPNPAPPCGNGIVEGTEQCDGDACCNTDCTFKLSSTVCRTSAGACDVAEFCTGTGAACPSDLKLTSECRAAAGQCDVAESCDGVSNDCPTDSFKIAGTSCDDGLFCNVDETCNGAGVCGSGTARSCSGNNIAGISQCNYDATLSTFDWRNPFESICDETHDECPTSDNTVNHVCADADNTDGVYNYNSATQTCSAECDGAGTECQPKIVSDYCYYGGSCNTNPASCSCNYASNEYCPVAGNVTDGICYYGTQSCTVSGCGLLTEEMGNYDTCNPVSGPIDTIPPTIDSHSNVTAEATGPTGAAVTYTSPATHDAVDGVGAATCLPASGSLFSLGDTTVTCNAQDVAGNHATPTTFKVTVVDTTPPTIDPHADVGPIEATSPAGASVTYTSPATHDLVDGDGTATCLPASGSTFALGNTTVICNATDAHSNAATPTNFKVTVVDTTPPVVTVPADITEEATGPSGNVVTFTATASDIVDGSITPTCLPDSGSTFAITDTLVTCSATDAHSNTGSSTFHITVQDTIPPTTTDNVPLAWQNASFDVTFDCTDSGSGCSKVYYTTDGNNPTTSSSFVDATSSWKFTVSTDGVYTIKYFAVDAVGNLESVETAANQLKIDQIKPTVSSSNGDQSYLQGQSVTVNFVCQDDRSGIKSCTSNPSYTNGSSLLNTLTAGDYSYNVTAIDKAGNTYTKTITYHVIPWTTAFHGLFAPLSILSKDFQKNSAIPVKFALIGESGNFYGGDAILEIQDAAIPGVWTAAISKGGANIGNHFRYDPSAGQYIFNLDTKMLIFIAGHTYNFRITMYGTSLIADQTAAIKMGK